MLTAVIMAATPIMAAAPVMTNATIEAMVSGGVPLPVIVRAIRTAAQIEFFTGRQDYARLKNAGASGSAADQIMKAIHQREYGRSRYHNCRLLNKLSPLRNRRPRPFRPQPRLHPGQLRRRVSVPAASAPPVAPLYQHRGVTTPFHLRQRPKRATRKLSRYHPLGLPLLHFRPFRFLRSPFRRRPVQFLAQRFLSTPTMVSTYSSSQRFEPNMYP